jgi:ankyrin repeat protein
MDARDHDGQTALMEAAKATMGSEDNCLQCVIALTQAGADAKAMDKGGQTPITKARQRGNTKIEDYLLSIVSAQEI